MVYPERQSWHCYGACGSGGDVFTFVMQIENIDFAETLHRLAQQVGITLSDHNTNSPHKAILAINEELNTFFQAEDGIRDHA